MSTAMYPGTFDPPSLGHMDIIRRASKLCSKLLVTLAHNSGKNTPLFSINERLSFLKLLTQDLRNVEVIHCEGLLIDFAQEKKADFIVRSLRSISDYDFEFEMSSANRKIGNIETLFLMADPSHVHIRSSLIRELAHSGKRLLEYVPEPIEEAVRRRFST